MMDFVTWFTHYIVAPQLFEFDTGGVDEVLFLGSKLRRSTWKQVFDIWLKNRSMNSDGAVVSFKPKWRPPLAKGCQSKDLRKI